MGRHRLDSKKGYLGNIDEIEGCQIQMFAYKIGDKLTFWLQRPYEHIKYAISEILPRLLLVDLLPERVIVDWGSMSQYLKGEPIKISAIAEIGVNRALSTMAQYPSKQYATFIMNMMKYSDSDLIKKICVAKVMGAGADHHSIVLVTHNYDKEVVEFELNRWNNMIQSSCINASLVWEVLGVNQIRYFF
jgi:hypothetical protein